MLSLKTNNRFTIVRRGILETFLPKTALLSDSQSLIQPRRAWTHYVARNDLELLNFLLLHLKC